MNIPRWSPLARFIIPWCFVTVYIFSLKMAEPERYLELIGIFGAYFFPPLGKESVIPLAISAGFDPLLVALGIASIDSIVAMFLAWNWDITMKIPLIGQWIERATTRGSLILQERPWIDRLAFTGLALFVLIPFQGSGAVGGSIVGRIMGMSSLRVWSAITIGALTGSLLIAYLSDSLLSLFQGGTYVFFAILIIGLAIAIIRNMRRPNKTS